MNPTLPPDRPAAHTPTPWMAESPISNWRIRGPNAEFIMESGPYGVRSKQDAAFIVQACNAHDGLVEALKDTIVGFENCMRSVKIDQELIDIKLQKARAALAQAEQGAP